MKITASVFNFFLVSSKDQNTKSDLSSFCDHPNLLKNAAISLVPDTFEKGQK